ncbi:MAG TPA: SRPBCC family protein [Fibrobacteria bacterium]|nr:SRPBCC family protein [Fibrobacteria bacterium]
MLKKILIGLAAVILVFVIVVALQPADFKIERSEVVAAAPEIAHSQVNDFTKWQDWSPWAKMDPDAKVTISEDPVGEGATYAWEGGKTGAGVMLITESTPERIDLDLDFIKPFKAENKVVFTFLPIHGGTQVTWTMTGENSFIGKAMCLFMDMDKMVGGDFEKGLKDIKRQSEIASGWIRE